MIKQLPSLAMLAALVILVALVGNTMSPSSRLDVTTGFVDMGIVLGLYLFVGITGVF